MWRYGDSAGRHFSGHHFSSIVTHYSLLAGGTISARTEGVGGLFCATHALLLGLSASVWHAMDNPNGNVMLLYIQRRNAS